jgi:outer membrane protein assembly factor BamA
MRGAHVRYANPWLAGNHLSAGVSASYYREMNRYEGFTEETFGAGVSVGSHLTADGALRLGAGADYLSLRASEGETICLIAAIASTGHGLTHDTPISTGTRAAITATPVTVNGTPRRQWITRR